MFPTWMQQMLNSTPCGECHAGLTVADITTVGIRRPSEGEAFFGEPVFVISFFCRNCGTQTDALYRRSLADVIAGVSAFVKVIEQECDGKKPPIAIPGHTRPAASSQPPPTDVSQIPESERVRPSLRRGHPLTPMTQEEIRAFINRLRRMSFKRNSKAFNHLDERYGCGAWYRGGCRRQWALRLS